MTEEMPRIRDCEALDCIYNVVWNCSAPVITVGRQGMPICKMFTTADLRRSDDSVAARVGACDMHMCLRNHELMCNAYAIKVRVREGQPQCLSFKNRYK